MVLAIIMALAVQLTACDRSELRQRMNDGTAHEQYARSLADAGLDGTALGRDWLESASHALTSPTTVALPFREAGYFAPDEAGAIAYRVQPQRGQQLRVTVHARTSTPTGAHAGTSSTTPSGTPPGTPAHDVGDNLRQAPAVRLFVDLYEVPLDSTRRTRHIGGSDSLDVLLQTTAGRDVSYLIRLQPELLRDVRYEITVEVAPSLAFPVEGRDRRAVQSYWGAARDGGARDHQGIDIFAARGTPAIASADGVVRNVRVTNLGGKVVWLSDTAAGQSLYYAHLDSQLVKPGDGVRVGDTLGLIGNTGNARITAPHLHFGIYRRGEGAVDPFPFVAAPRGRPPLLTADTIWLGRDARTARDEVMLRAAPSARATAVRAVAGSTMLLVEGASGNWLRVRLPDATPGYLPASTVQSTTTPIRAGQLATNAPIHAQPSAASLVIDSLGGEGGRMSSVPVLARYGEWLLVDPPEGRRGWVEMASR